MINFNELWQYILTAKGAGKLEAIGDILQYAIAWFALIVVALSGDVVLAHAWLYAGISQIILVETLKRGLNHTTLGMRPNGGPHSFPSGHTAGAFFGATFITVAYGIWWGTIPLILAAVTGLSRVVAHKHWTRDVIAGAIIATTCSYTIIHHMTGA
jgi:membrane-associated phospholipid phosphatase